MLKGQWDLSFSEVKAEAKVESDSLLFLRRVSEKSLTCVMLTFSSVSLKMFVTVLASFLTFFCYF